MGRILAIDYGRKRIGLAVTDNLKLIANNLDTVSPNEIWTFLEKYIKSEKVERIVVGFPRQMNNQPSEAVLYIEPFVKSLRKKYPEIEVDLYDERFTSKMAAQAMLQGGVKKKDRQNKALVDKISANLILQSYLEYIK